MKSRPFLFAILSGGWIGLTLIALLYLGQKWAGLPFVPFGIFDWMARVLPGWLVTFGIDTIVSIINRLNLGPTAETAKLAEMSLAVIQFLASWVVFGLVLAVIGKRDPHKLFTFGAIGGLIGLAVSLVALFALGVSAGIAGIILWLGIVFLGGGLILAYLVSLAFQETPVRPVGSLTRRQFLYLVGAGSFTVLVTALGVNLTGEEETSLPKTGSQEGKPEPSAANTSGPAQSPPAQALTNRIEPAPGTRPELTRNDNFYRIDINTVPPKVEAANWQLDVSGMVNNPLSLTLDEIRSRPSVSQVITLSCISNRLGGDLISTSLWTGVPLKAILEEAGLQEGAQEVYIESVDGFYESVPMEEAMDERTLLVYEMNGEPLPTEHGFPLRIYIPNHFGMKQPKWITRLEVIDHPGAGYWVERGWSETAIPPTTSVIDTAAQDANSMPSDVVPVGGMAYAGARGISKVELQVDDGPWQAAELRTPPLSPLTWVQWRYNWNAEAGRHTLRVRAYDGTGQLQPLEQSEPHPNGATGVFSETAVINQGNS